MATKLTWFSVLVYGYSMQFAFAFAEHTYFSSADCFKGLKLDGASLEIFMQDQVSNLRHCVLFCLFNSRCSSFNWIESVSSKQCELKNANSVADMCSNSALVPLADARYYILVRMSVFGFSTHRFQPSPWTRTFSLLYFHDYLSINRRNFMLRVKKDGVLFKFVE